MARAAASTTSSAALRQRQQQRGRSQTQRNQNRGKLITPFEKTASSPWSNYLLEPVTYATTSSSFFNNSDTKTRATNGNGGDSDPARCVSSLLSPNWRSMLFGDASVTKTLQLLTLETTKIKLITPHQEALSLPELPIEAQGVFNGLYDEDEEFAHRQVYLKSGEKCVAYASSWWRQETLRAEIQDETAPMWKNLAQNRREVFRDIRRVFRGENEMLARTFRRHCVAADVDDADGEEANEEELSEELWGRTYVFWRNGEPLTLVYEVFSPMLSEFLGENPPHR